MKHIKSFENRNIKKYRIYYYIIPTENLEEQVKKINCPEKFINELSNSKINTNMKNNKYVYFSFNDNNWDWMPLEYHNDKNVVDGEYIYIEEKIDFYGYSNLTPQQKEEVLQIKEKLEMLKNADKYNL